VPKTEEKLAKLCKGVRAIGHGAEIRIKPSEVVSDQWSVMIFVGAAIIAFSDFLPLEEALDQSLKKLATISSRMMAAIRQTPPSESEPPPPPSGSSPLSPLSPSKPKPPEGE
jgi:hypothetical protein